MIQGGPKKTPPSSKYGYNFLYIYLLNSIFYNMLIDILPNNRPKYEAVSTLGSMISHGWPDRAIGQKCPNFCMFSLSLPQFYFLDYELIPYFQHTECLRGTHWTNFWPQKVALLVFGAPGVQNGVPPEPPKKPCLVGIQIWVGSDSKNGSIIIW